MATMIKLRCCSSISMATIVKLRWCLSLLLFSGTFIYTDNGKLFFHRPCEIHKWPDGNMTMPNSFVVFQCLFFQWKLKCYTLCNMLWHCSFIGFSMANYLTKHGIFITLTMVNFISFSNCRVSSTDHGKFESIT